MSSITAPVGMAPAKPSESPLARGLLVALVAASIGALYMVIARWGMARGMDSSDMTFLRFGVAGVVTRLMAVAAAVLWTEAVVQGLIAGAGTLYTYSKMVALLGPARAAVLPAWHRASPPSLPGRCSAMCRRASKPRGC